MATAKSTKSNHTAKCVSAVKCVCSCGWQSVHWYGKGAKFYAKSEWLIHYKKCEVIEAQKSE